MQKKLKQSYIMLAITLVIYPLLWIIPFFAYPLNHGEVVEKAQSLVSGMDSNYYLCDEKIINNVDYLLFSLKNGSESKIVVYSSKAPVLSRFSDISYLEMKNLQTIGEPIDSIRITDTSLKVERLPIIHEWMPPVFSTLVWIAWLLFLSKRAISLRKTLNNKPAGGDVPDGRD